MGASKSESFSVKHNEMATLFKALSHPARIAIVDYLLSVDSCICGDIVNELPLAQPTISQHLKELKNEFRTLESQYNSTKHVDEMGNLIYPSNVFHRSDTNDSIQIEEIDVHVPKFSAAVAAPLIPENSNKSYRSSIKDNLLNQRS